MGLKQLFESITDQFELSNIQYLEKYYEPIVRK